MTTKTTAVAETEEVVPALNLQRIQRAEVLVPIIGTAPLIVHKWSEKARRQMLENAQGKKRVKTPKNPQQEYEDSLYRLEDGRNGFPAVAFKAAIANAARYFGKEVSITLLKQALFVRGVGPDQLVPLIGEPKLREDTARVGQGGTENRFRGEFREWSAMLTIVYIPSMLSIDSLVSLVDAAGLGGVGEWRPSAPKSSTGMYGTFTVREDMEIVEVKP